MVYLHFFPQIISWLWQYFWHHRNSNQAIRGFCISKNCYFAEAAVFLKILQISQDNTCIGVSFLSCRASGLQLLLKRNYNAGVTLWKLEKFWEHLFYRTSPVAASVFHKIFLRIVFLASVWYLIWLFRDC